jgi:(4S)-4-hydroxy-5-phosphonooxypentane-2,3-dione isomerase
MSKLVIMGTIEIAPGKRDQVVPLPAAHGARCPKDEPGTLEFEIAVPRDDDSKLLICEVYQDDAAFEVHRNAPSIALARGERRNGRQGDRDQVHACRTAARASAQAAAKKSRPGGWPGRSEVVPGCVCQRRRTSTPQTATV